MASPGNKTGADSLRAARQHASKSASPFALSLVPKHQASHAPSDQGGQERLSGRYQIALPGHFQLFEGLEGMFQ